MPAKFTGAFVPLVTPRSVDGSPHYEEIRILVDRMLKSGLDGIVALGSTSELASLSEAERGRVLETVIDAVGGRAPVIAGIGSSVVNEVYRAVEHAAAAGADATLVVPPFYYPLDDNAVFEFFHQVSRRARVPILAYQIPRLSGVSISAKVVIDLAREGLIVGVKDSNRDFEYLHQIILECGEIEGFSAFTGSDNQVLSTLLVGGAGSITVCANVVPSLIAELTAATRQGNMTLAGPLQLKLIQIANALRRGAFPANAKAALTILGMNPGDPFPPVLPLTPGQQEQLRNDLLTLCLPVAQTAD